MTVLGLSWVPFWPHFRSLGDVLGASWAILGLVEPGHERSGQARSTEVRSEQVWKLPLPGIEARSGQGGVPPSYKDGSSPVAWGRGAVAKLISIIFFWGVFSSFQTTSNFTCKTTSKQVPTFRIFYRNPSQNGTKIDPQIKFLATFWQYFFRMRFGIDFGWIFGSSKPWKSIKTIVCSMVFANFQKLVVLKKTTKKHRFWMDLGMPKPSKIDEKLRLKTSMF